MKSLREIIVEGIFAAHNGIVLHRLLSKHIEDNSQKVLNASSRGYYTVQASKIHKSLPKDLDIAIQFGRSDNPVDNSGGSFSNHEMHMKGRHLISIEIRHPYDGKLNKQTMIDAFNQDHVKKLFVHEHNHYSDYKDIEKTHGRKEADKDYWKGSNAMDHYPGKIYFNDPGEVRSYSRENAWHAREIKKRNPKMSAKEVINQLIKTGSHNDKDFFEKTDSHNLNKLTGYIKRMSKK